MESNQTVVSQTGQCKNTLEVSLMGIQLIWELKIKLLSFVYTDQVVRESPLQAHRLLRNFHRHSSNKRFSMESPFKIVIRGH